MTARPSPTTRKMFTMNNFALPAPLISSHRYKILVRSRLGRLGIAALCVPALQLLGTALLPAHAADNSAASDNSLILISSAMVLLMTPGLAFFYGGFVQGRNVLNTMGMSIVMMGIATLTWAGVGFSLAFGDGGSWNAVIGNPLDHALLENLSGSWDGLSIPGLSIRPFSGHVCDHHPRLNFRGTRGTAQLPLLVPIHPHLAPGGLRPSRTHVFGEVASSAKIWTSPVALWCTSVPAFPPLS